jgi:hypothetical protein
MKNLRWGNPIHLLVTFAILTIAMPVFAQQKTDTRPADNPLVQLLESKGILTHEEAAQLGQAASADESNQRLAQLLLSKGLISQQEYAQTVSASYQPTAGSGSGNAQLVPAVLRINTGNTTVARAGSPVATPAPPAEPKVVPAITPIRVLPINIPQPPKGVIPGIKLGSDAALNIYGFLKASAVYDSTNSGGGTFGNNDFPLPLLLADTGPDKGSQFHVKARAARAGANFSYPINGPNVTLTGKIEFDWEGDYTVANNRNISSVRSSQASIRLAWARLDAKLGTVPWFAEFGQDWTMLGSSTLMDLFESTGNGVGFGNFYERIPQFKTGFQFSAGKLKIEPEVAITLGAFGDNNLNNSVAASLAGTVGQIPVGQQNQGREGAILGSASGQPGVQARLVFDFPLNSSWKGVPNAEIIFSGGHAQAREILPAANIPSTLIPASVGLACPGGGAAGSCSLRSFFPTGLTMNIPQNAYSAEVQLPTPWVTLVAKAYRGSDLRFMFAGQLNTAFADTSGGPTIAVPATQLACIPGSGGCVGGSLGPPVVFGTASLGQSVWTLSGDPITFIKNSAGAAVPAPLRPIRGYGGVVQLGFPLSRIFGASPEGLNTGWTLYAGYGVDGAYARDVIRPGGNKLQRSDYVPVSLRYKINKWATLVNEATWYDTRAADSSLLLFRGVPARVNHDWREEFGTIFTF